jgi:hypothetical protein
LLIGVVPSRPKSATYEAAVQNNGFDFSKSNAIEIRDKGEVVGLGYAILVNSMGIENPKTGEYEFTIENLDDFIKQLKLIFSQ